MTQPFSAKAARQATNQALKAQEQAKKEAKLAAEAKAKSDYQNALKIPEYLLTKIANRIREAAEAGKTEFTYYGEGQHHPTWRNTRVPAYARGQFDGLAVELQKLGYDAKSDVVSRFTPDCDGYGNTEKWMKLTVKW